MADAEVGGNIWGYLVNSDKTAAPLLEQLCFGLTRIISRLGPGSDGKLTPERMAAFYKSVGGHFDMLFLGPNENASAAGTYFNGGLSFMYRTLGCYHSLEPTHNAFETPCVPCLTPVGFVRWQTLQLLLCPDEHAGYLQKAVEMYDIPRPDGRSFPKKIPRDAFPEKPDEDMDKWFRQVTSKLNHQDHVNRLKNSPYSSPNPQAFERPEGYFGPPVPHIRKQSRESKERSSEDDRRRAQFDSRRVSVSDADPPGSARDYGRAPSSYQSRDSSRRSASAQRLGHRPRAATTAHPSHYRNSTSSSQREEYDRSGHGPQRHPPPYSRHHSSTKYQHPSAEDEPLSEDSSPDDNDMDRKRNRYNSSPRDDFKKKGLLAPALSIFSTKRRHSHDAGTMRKDDRPHRSDGRQLRNIRTEESPRPSANVHFRRVMDEDECDSPHSPVRSTTSRRSETFPRSPASNDVTYEYPQARDPSSGSGSDRRNGHGGYRRSSKTQDVPLRVSTVTGVGGRRYANAEPNSGASSGGPDTPPHRDSKTRYSVAV